MTTINASFARPTSTGVRKGVDVSISVVLDDGTVLSGEITLAPDHTGALVAYGMGADYWVSGALLAGLREAVGDDAERLTEVLSAIEVAAQREAARVEVQPWTYEGYWATVIGAHLDAARAVIEFDLKPGDDRGFSEWLVEAEYVAWSAGGCSGKEYTEEWAEFHNRAVRELADAANKVRS